MSEVREIRMEDENGNIYYPHNTGEVTFLKDGRTVQEFFDNGGAIGGGYLGSFANGLVFGKDGAPDSRVQTLCSGDINMFGPSESKKVSLGYETNAWKEAWIGSYSNAANGYTTLPNGFMLQWGEITLSYSNLNTNTVYVNYPVSFPNSSLSITGTINAQDVNTNARGILGYIYLNNKINFRYRLIKAGLPLETSIDSIKISWQAIGC